MTIFPTVGSSKICFVQRLPRTERRAKARIAKGERGIRQRRFLEPAIRSDTDYRPSRGLCALDPMRHGVVHRVADWPYSSFHRYVRLGILPDDWASGDDAELEVGEYGLIRAINGYNAPQPVSSTWPRFYRRSVPVHSAGYRYSGKRGLPVTNRLSGFFAKAARQSRLPRR